MIGYVLLIVAAACAIHPPLLILIGAGLAALVLFFACFWLAVALLGHLAE